MSIRNKASVTTHAIAKYGTASDAIFELSNQLAAAQEEITRQCDENVKLVMAMSDTQINALAAIEGSNPEDIATIGKQCFEIAKLRVALKEVQDQLAKAEQRVAEACAKLYLEDYDLTDIADRVRSGEWRKFRKEV